MCRVHHEKRWAGKAQAGMKRDREISISVGRNVNNLRYTDDTTLMAESEEELRAS